MKFIQKILDWIEIRRGSSNPAIWLLVFLKDVFWFFSYFIPAQILKLLQNKTQTGLLFFYSLIDHYRAPVEKYYKVSFCITCMDRLSHLKKTLRKNINNNQDYPNLEFVLIDYNSADGLEEWVFANFQEELRSGLLVYYRTIESAYFKMARAKNIAHQMASGDIVCNLDADNYTGKDFAFYINLTISGARDIIGLQKYNKNFVQGHISDCGGRIFLTKDNFLKLGGYNEKFIGWGKEDRELIARAGKMGLKEEYIPRYFLGAIKHSNRLRIKNTPYSIKQADDNNENLLQQSYLKSDFSISNDFLDTATVKRITIQKHDLRENNLLNNETWAITSFFNPQNHKQKLDNYYIFREQLKRQGVKLLTIECVFKNQWFVLQDKDADLLISVRSDSVLWQKERLLNIALEKLPTECRRVVWLDADVIFLNDNWLADTVKLLEDYPVVQCFSQAVYLTKNENWRLLARSGNFQDRLVESYGSYYERQSGTELQFKTAGGFAWAARKDILATNRFFDKSILGGGDWKIISAFIGRPLQFDYEISWAQKIYSQVGGKIASVPGVVFHLYHGELSNRLYDKRQQILDKYQFNPSRDLILNKDACWSWSDKANPEFKKAVSQYFQLRNEKNTWLSNFFNHNIYKHNPDLIPSQGYPSKFRGSLDRLMGRVGIFLQTHWPELYRILKRK